jgi:perosamine synthetase
MHSRLKLDIGWRDLIWTAAGAPSSKQDAEDAIAAIRATFASGHVVVGLSVRTLFDALLAEMATPADAPVLMSGVNIQNMADIVRAQNLCALAVDVTGDTLAPAPGALAAGQEASGAKICVVTQLFGAANFFEDLSLLRQRGVFVIEDAAQAFADGSHIGLREVDVSLFSFGPIKRRTALGGAVAVFRDAELARRVEERLRTYPVLPEAWHRKRAAKYVVLKALSAPWVYGLLVRAIALSGKDPDAVIGAAARGFSGKAMLQAIKNQPPRRMVVLMARQIANAPSAQTRRRICDEFVGALPETARVGSAARDNAYWLMPVRANSPQSFVSRLRAEGFDASRGATSLRALDPERTEGARMLMDGVVYVPNPADLTSRARSKLQGAVLEALTDHG